MTITSQTTRQGKLIHRLPPGDLVDARESGDRLRAYCPIHGGDHQRSLSIEPATSWGFCHCCHATMLLETMPPIIVGRPGNRQDRRDAAVPVGPVGSVRRAGGLLSRSLSDGASAGPLPTSSLRPRASLAQRGRPATSLPSWQREEVAALTAVALFMREALASSPRAQLYLDERGLPPALALASGVGYLSCLVWEQAPVSAEQQSLLRRWIGRIVFQLGSPAGQGVIGRTLLRWEPGMDENAHNALLDLPGAGSKPTRPAGSALTCLRDRNDSLHNWNNSSWLKAALIA